MQDRIPGVSAGDRNPEAPAGLGTPFTPTSAARRPACSASHAWCSRQRCRHGVGARRLRCPPGGHGRPGRDGVPDVLLEQRTELAPVRRGRGRRSPGPRCDQLAHHAAHQLRARSGTACRGRRGSRRRRWRAAARTRPVRCAPTLSVSVSTTVAVDARLPGQRVLGVEHRLLVLLQVLVVPARQPLHRREPRR